MPPATRPGKTPDNSPEPKTPEGGENAMSGRTAPIGRRVEVATDFIRGK